MCTWGHGKCYPEFNQQRGKACIVPYMAKGKIICAQAVVTAVAHLMEEDSNHAFYSSDTTASGILHSLAWSY